MTCVIDIGNVVTAYIFKRNICIDLIHTSLWVNHLMRDIVPGMSEARRARVMALYARGAQEITLDVNDKHYVFSPERIADNMQLRPFFSKLIKLLVEHEYKDVMRFVLVGGGANLLELDATHGLLVELTGNNLIQTHIPLHDAHGREWAMVFAVGVRNASAKKSVVVDILYAYLATFAIV